MSTGDVAAARTAQCRPHDELAQHKHHQTREALVQSADTERGGGKEVPTSESETGREPAMNLVTTVSPLADAACQSSQHARPGLKSLKKDRPSSRRPQSPHQSPRTPVQRVARRTHTEEEETRRVELQVVMRSASPRARSARHRFQEMEAASQSEKRRRRESLRMAATATATGSRTSDL